MKNNYWRWESVEESKTFITVNNKRLGRTEKERRKKNWSCKRQALRKFSEDISKEKLVFLRDNKWRTPLKKVYISRPIRYPLTTLSSWICNCIQFVQILAPFLKIFANGFQSSCKNSFRISPTLTRFTRRLMTGELETLPLLYTIWCTTNCCL